MTTNKRYLINILSAALIISGIATIPSIAVSLAYEDMSVVKVLSAALLLSTLIGLFGKRAGGEISTQVRPRILYMTTVSAWLMLIFISALIYYFAMPGYGISDAILEATASWTTTGIGAYDVSKVPAGLQLWRATCNWLGGIGIITVTLSLIPSRRFMGWMLAATEFPGPDFLKIETDFRKYYRRIIVLYAGISVVQFVMLLIAGMPFMQAVMTALSNSACGGLHHINNGAASSLSVSLKIIITIFAFICSLNSMLLFALIKRKWKIIKNSSELKFYVGYILAAALLVSLFIIRSGGSGNPLSAAGSSLMQVISVFSTSGYIITDVASWPEASIIIILLLGFTGACSLSTGGGIKAARVIIAIKTSSSSIYKSVHPSSVRSLTFDKKPMKNDQVVPANLLIALFMITFFIGALLLSLDDVSLYQALNYSQAMITNTGISLGSLENPGVAESFSSYGRMVLSVLMLAGRLEIYPLLMLAFRGFWKPESSI